LNHRLELTVSDAVDEVKAVNHFQHFFDKLYSLYSCSKKNTRELRDFAIRVEDSWPAYLVTGHGEEEVKTMCHRFNIPFVKTVNAFRDYVDDIGRREPPDLKPLLNCLLNIIVSDAGCNLLVSHVSSLMFIKIHGPPVAMQKLASDITDLLLTHRHALLSPSHTKTKTMPHSRNICKR
jgi:hypothetical protein